MEVHAVPVSFAQTRENPDPGGQWGGDGGVRGGGERCDQSSEEGEAGKEPSQEALRRMVGDAIEEAARRAVKEAAQEAVYETTQEAVRKEVHEAAQGAVYRAVREAVHKAV